MDFAQQSFAGGNIEVMQEIREQDEIVTLAIIDIKGAPGKGAIPASRSRRPRVCPRHFENLRPVHRHNLRVRIMFG